MHFHKYDKGRAWPKPPIQPPIQQILPKESAANESESAAFSLDVKELAAALSPILKESKECSCSNKNEKLVQRLMLAVTLLSVVCVLCALIAAFTAMSLRVLQR